MQNAVILRINVKMRIYWDYYVANNGPWLLYILILSFLIHNLREKADCCNAVLEKLTGSGCIEET